MQPKLNASNGTEFVKIPTRYARMPRIVKIFMKIEEFIKRPPI